MRQVKASNDCAMADTAEDYGDLKLAVLISGSGEPLGQHARTDKILQEATLGLNSIYCLTYSTGSNLQALIDAKLPITYVLSNRKAAYGLERAAKASIPTDVFSIFAYNKANPGKTREDYDTALAERILAQKPDLVVLAGFMHILSESFLNPFIAANVRILNLHPALPGEFDGAHAIDRAYDAFKQGLITRTGCMIHEVVKEVDRGQPLLIREVPFQEGDTLADIEERIHQVEHVIIVEATKQALQKLKQQKASQA